MKNVAKYSSERKLLNEAWEKRGGNNPGIPGKRPSPPPALSIERNTRTTKIKVTR